MKLIYKFFGILSIFLLVPSCSVLSPVNTTHTSYQLKSIPSVPQRKTHQVSLLVAIPQTSMVYDTTRMAYTRCPYQIAYFAKNRWADTPANMLQPLMVQTLQNTKYYKTVLSSPMYGQYDYVLNTQLVELKQDFTSNPSVVKLVVRAQIIKTSSNLIIASKQFTIVEVAPQNTPYGGVVAANHAVSTFLAALTKFCLSRT